ncbi:prepilin-type N-terminal cleavage/methylation domain-containing protein [Gammaproteobacteria bacterium]|nr:prepilin-type N-terminal cleavage/methylation domain-containing protein [Gammaproteobacteria bacterium]
MKLCQPRGFTLIEVVVSLLLLAIISVMSYQAVDVVLATDQRSRSELADEISLHRTWQIVGNDLIHLRPRMFADGLGGIEPAYVTERYGALLSFTRGGGPLLESNPTGLTRVRYVLNEEHELLRSSLPAYLSPRNQESQTRVLLTGVSEINFEQLNWEDYFVATWPLINAEEGTPSLPRMIRVTISLDDGSSTWRLFPGVESDA